MKLVRVEWVDSNTHMGWDARKHSEYPVATATTVGFLLHKDNKKVSVALCLGTDNDANGVMTIPRGCVTRIVELSEVK